MIQRPSKIETAQQKQQQHATTSNPFVNDSQATSAVKTGDGDENVVPVSASTILCCQRYSADSSDSGFMSPDESSCGSRSPECDTDDR